nr:MAG TPA: Translocon-associated protein beta (TRAPB) [Caudoviricetes sp.]
MTYVTLGLLIVCALTAAYFINALPDLSWRRRVKSNNTKTKRT